VALKDNREGKISVTEFLVVFYSTFPRIKVGLIYWATANELAGCEDWGEGGRGEEGWCHSTWL
jgi:hypothetical protein